MSTNDSACRATPGEIMVQRDNLDKGIEELDQVIVILEIRLASVLRSSPPVSPSVLSMAKDSSLVPLAGDLQRFLQRVNDIADKTRDITSRLEL